MYWYCHPVSFCNSNNYNQSCTVLQFVYAHMLPVELLPGRVTIKFSLLKYSMKYCFTKNIENVYNCVLLCCTEYCDFVIICIHSKQIVCPNWVPKPQQCSKQKKVVFYGLDNQYYFRIQCSSIPVIKWHTCIYLAIV